MAWFGGWASAAIKWQQEKAPQSGIFTSHDNTALLARLRGQDSLMDLPAEVRTTIYNYFWASVIPAPIINVQLRPNRAPRYTHGFRGSGIHYNALTQVNRALRSETMDTCYSRLSGYVDCRGDPAYCNLRHLRDYMTSVTDQTISLISYIEITDLHYYCGCGGDDDDGMDMNNEEQKAEAEEEDSEDAGSTCTIAMDLRDAQAAVTITSCQGPCDDNPFLESWGAIEDVVIDLDINEGKSVMTRDALRQILRIPRCFATGGFHGFDVDHSPRHDCFCGIGDGS